MHWRQPVAPPTLSWVQSCCPPIAPTHPRRQQTRQFACIHCQRQTRPCPAAIERVRTRSDGTETISDHVIDKSAVEFVVEVVVLSSAGATVASPGAFKLGNHAMSLDEFFLMITGVKLDELTSANNNLTQIACISLHVTYQSQQQPKRTLLPVRTYV